MRIAPSRLPFGRRRPALSDAPAQDSFPETGTRACLRPSIATNQAIRELWATKPAVDAVRQASDPPARTHLVQYKAWSTTRACRCAMEDDVPEGRPGRIHVMQKGAGWGGEFQGHRNGEWAYQVLNRE